MSEALNEVFVDNFQKDPTLTWQYFGSSTGFFRLYPGAHTSGSHRIHACFPKSQYVQWHGVKTTWAELKINIQLCKPNSVLTPQLTMQETVCQPWWVSLIYNMAAGEFSPAWVCMCFRERGVISGGFVTQLVLLICYLIHLSLIWQFVTIHPCIHLFVRLWLRPAN